MKYLVASDLHGCEEGLKFLVMKFKQLCCDKLILLGDYLGGDPKTNESIINLLNFFKDDLIALEGNCDRFIQEALDFELKDSFTFRQNGRIYCLNHGDNLDTYMIILLI